MDWLQAVQARCQTRWQGKELLIEICPYCHNQRYNCQVDSVVLRFHTWCCKNGGGLNKLLEKLGIEGVRVKTVAVHEEKKGVEKVELPLEAKPLWGGGLDDNMIKGLAKRFLIHRGLNYFDMRAYNIRYCEYGTYQGRVIFPLLEQGTLVYFVARTFRGDHPPYLNPKVDKERFLSVFECALSLDVLVLVEGIFDAIKVHKAGFSVVPLLGKSISSIQTEKIRKRNYKMVYVMLDEGEHEESFGIAARLKCCNVECRIVELPEGDPGESSTMVIQEAIGYAQEPSLFGYLDKKLEMVV